MSCALYSHATRMHYSLLLITAISGLYTLSNASPITAQSRSIVRMAPRTGPIGSNTSTPGYKVNAYYTSANFFQNFEFFSAADPTGGHVQYQDRAGASKLALAGRLPDHATQPIYLGVDHESLAPNGRPSTRVQSTKSWNHGLFIFDIVHMPSGPGTWPAAWLVGANATWPMAGEIDVLEGVNDQIGNRMTLHTNAGCSLQKSSSSAYAFSGAITTSNCDVDDPNQAKNAGCQIADSDAVSYGTAFNAAGGGIYALEWSSERIAIWFFSHSSKDTPTELVSALNAGSSSSSSSSSASSAPSTTSLDTSSWSQPRALFPASSDCDIDAHFKNQLIVINTSLCGQWAGAVWQQCASCMELAPTCDQAVSENPGAFKEAFWAIKSVSVWERV